MLLDERGARRKDCRECQKKSADARPKLPSDNPHERRDRSACQEPDPIFVPSGPAQAVKVDNNFTHALAHQASHSPNAAVPQTTSARLVPTQALTRPRIITQLTHAAYRKKAIAPGTMECASIAAYPAPSRRMAKPRVASAIDGAAPNSPAKLWGLNRSLRAANSETNTPPTRNRNSSSSISRATRAFLSLYQMSK